jgi:SAM-dependent methyltransferase
MSRKVLSKLQIVIRHPDNAYRAIVQKMKNAFLWDYYYSSLREPKTKVRTPKLNSAIEDIVDQLKKNRIPVIDFEIHIDDFRQYLEKAQYNKFQGYYGAGKGENFIEKSLEHYLAAKVLKISKNDVYIDVASSNSPVAEIYYKLYGCKTYRQDLKFPIGVSGNTIGGDACNMPIEDGFATKMALHCSFEHFEEESDIRFIKEASRVLRKGGKLCIVPLYLFEDHIIIINPVNLPRGGIQFDSDAKLYCVKGWTPRHVRFYDVPHLISRIIENSDLKPTIYLVQNQKEVDTSCYVKFVAVFEKN